MTKSFSKIADLLFVIYGIREKYLNSLKGDMPRKPLRIPRSAHLNFPIFPNTIQRSIIIAKNYSGREKRFEVVKSYSENHFKIRLCLNNQNDYLFRYAANYYKKKLSLHAFYNWKMAKLFSIGATLKTRRSTPRFGTLNQVTNLSHLDEERDFESYREYFSQFDKFRLD